MSKEQNKEIRGILSDILDKLTKKYQASLHVGKDYTVAQLVEDLCCIDCILDEVVERKANIVGFRRPLE